MDCGSNCLKIIAKSYGRFFSLNFLKNPGTKTREGVAISNVIHDVKKIGFKARAVKVSKKIMYNSVRLADTEFYLIQIENQEKLD